MIARDEKGNVSRARSETLESERLRRGEAFNMAADATALRRCTMPLAAAKDPGLPPSPRKSPLHSIKDMLMIICFWALRHGRRRFDIRSADRQTTANHSLGKTRGRISAVFQHYLSNLDIDRSEPSVPPLYTGLIRADVACVPKADELLW